MRRGKTHGSFMRRNIIYLLLKRFLRTCLLLSASIAKARAVKTENSTRIGYSKATNAIKRMRVSNGGLAFSTKVQLAVKRYRISKMRLRSIQNRGLISSAIKIHG